MGYTDHVPGSGYFATDDGRPFSAHFWLYSLSMVPAVLFMRLISGNEFAAFQVTNVLFFMVAIAVALGYGDDRHRFVFLGFPFSVQCCGICDGPVQRCTPGLSF